MLAQISTSLGLKDGQHVDSIDRLPVLEIFIRGKLALIGLFSQGIKAKLGLRVGTKLDKPNRNLW